MINEEIEKKYVAVQSSLENALQKANSIEVSGVEENDELSEIKKVLESLNDSFKVEIEKLKKCSEWDKLCIAFFGETNAGKSTIIETLRIVYDEEIRRAELLDQEKDYCAELKKHCSDYKQLISSLEDVNFVLEKQSKKHTWLGYVIFCILGIVIGLVIANLRLIVW